MKIFISIFLLLFISACASIDKNKIAPGYFQAFNSIKQLIKGGENNIQPEVITNIPYASMLVKIGNGPTALMILEKVADKDYTWLSADGVYLVIRNGRIIKTHGLPNNLKEKLSAFNNWNEELYDDYDLISYNSYSDPVLNNLRVVSNHAMKGEIEVELMFETKQLILIEESIESDEVGWRKTNTYWIDESNFVWKSVQHISPRLPEIYIEVTKKPR